MDEKTTNVCPLVRKFKPFAVKHSLSFRGTAQPGWLVTTSWHTGSSSHDSFHSSLFHSWTDTSVSCWLTKRSVLLRSRCVFRNTARPASPGTASVWYRGFWKLFTGLVKAWEDSVGTTQNLRFITTWYLPVREHPLENTHAHQGLLQKQKLRQGIPICFLMKPQPFCVSTNISYNLIPCHECL